MALLRKINTKAKKETNTGFGANASDYGGRFVNKNGQPNVNKKGLTFLERISWYHTMLTLPRWKFFAIIFLFYIIVNLFFAGIYFLIGIEHLGGLVTTSTVEQFGEAYFFSAQTFTTVGYGRINPTGFLTSAVAALQALLGLLSFALATGLLYGRFSKPKAYLRFSTKAVIAPFENGLGLMVRVAPYKNINLGDAVGKMTLGLAIEENGKLKNEFFPLELEYESINALTLSWTMVHPINENSPLYRLTLEDYKTLKGELIVYIKAFDDMFSSTVVARTSYVFSEFVVGAKFIPMYHRNNDGSSTVLDFDKLDVYKEMDISHLFATDSAVVNG